MKTLTLTLFIALGAFAASCAGTETGNFATVPQVDENGNPIDWEKEIEAYNADPNNEIKIICEKVVPTGSHIPVTRCQTTAQKKNRERQDQRWMEEFTRSSR